MSDDLVARLDDMARCGNALRQDWTREMQEAAARIADLTRQLAEARDALAVSAGRLTWCAGILPSDKSRDLVSEWADEARILSAMKDTP